MAHNVLAGLICRIVHKNKTSTDMNTNNGTMFSNESLDSSETPQDTFKNVDEVFKSSTWKDVLFVKKSQLIFKERLGRGSFGTVFRGLLKNQDVAIKCFTVDNSVSRLNRALTKAYSQQSFPGKDQKHENRKICCDIKSLEREVSILKSLSYNKIVRFIGVCLDPPSIIMDYYEKGSLYDFIKYARKFGAHREEFSWDTRLKIAFDAACGMEYLHNNQEYPVFHGDLKSPNLLLDKNYNCYVSDFNTSKFITAAEIEASRMANNPFWLAPEIYYKNKFTKAVDVYPFGIIMWELLTLMVPFEKPNGDVPTIWSVGISVSLKDERPIIPANEDLVQGPCPFYEEYCELMEQCWDREESQRPSYIEIVDELHKMLQQRNINVASMELPSVAIISPPNHHTNVKLTRSDRLSSNDVEKLLKNADANETAQAIDRIKLGCIRQFPSGSSSSSSFHKQSSGVTDSMNTLTNKDKIKTAIHEFEGPTSDLGNSDLLHKDSLSETESMIFRNTSPEAQRRWMLIKSVVRVLTDQRTYQTASMNRDLRTSLSLVLPKSADSPKQNINAEVSTKSDVNPSGGGQSEKIENRGSLGFQILREQFSAVLDPPLHKGWDILSGNNLQKLRSMKSMKIQDKKSSVEKIEPISTAKLRWQFLKETFFPNETPCSLPESWRNLLEILFPHEETSDVQDSTFDGEKTEQVNPVSKMHQEREGLNETLQGLEIWEMLKNNGPILNKHWPFLLAFVEQSLNDFVEDDIDNLNGKYLLIGRMKVVETNGPKIEKWNFFRDWMLSGQFSDDWEPIIDFVKTCEQSPQGQQWNEFRALFFGTPEIRDQVQWGFLKDLFLRFRIP